MVQHWPGVWLGRGFLGVRVFGVDGVKVQSVGPEVSTGRWLSWFGFRFSGFRFSVVWHVGCVEDLLNVLWPLRTCTYTLYTHTYICIYTYTHIRTRAYIIHISIFLHRDYAESCSAF